MHQILALWAHPRSLSTALERIVIERGDFEVMHEPFSVVYYFHEQRATAAHANVCSAEPADYASIRDRILQAARNMPVCFKDMCYHCHDHLMNDESFLRRITNVFLIRDPRPTIASHFAKNPHVTLDEIGYEQQANVFRRISQINGEPPMVIGAEDLQQKPVETMRALWEHVGVDDRPQALRWQAGHRPEWDTWPAWHQEVARTTGIQRRQTTYRHTVEDHSKLSAFYDHHRRYYDELNQHRN